MRRITINEIKDLTYTALITWCCIGIALVLMITPTFFHISTTNSWLTYLLAVGMITVSGLSNSRVYLQLNRLLNEHKEEQKQSSKVKFLKKEE